MSAPELDVSWDPAKAQSNLAKHGVAFAQAATVLLDPLALTVFDAAHSDEEERWFTLGQSSDGALLAVAHTYRVIGPASAQVRVISARPATRHERDQYQNTPR
ncbi:MAG: BrnT family toxin [Rudaea sp.]